MLIERSEAPEPGERRCRLAPHLGLVVALFLTLLVITPTGDITLPDEGVYLAQAAALADGSWWTGRAFPQLPPRSYVDAVIPEFTDAGEMAPYARHPLFPILLSIGYLLAGPTGALATSLLALLVAALAAARLAAHIDARGEVSTFYLVALGSPLLFSGWQVAAHSFAAACAALGALSVVNHMRTRRWPWLLATGLAAGGCVMVRSEGLVLCAAAAGLLIAAGGLAVIRSRRITPTLTAGVSVAVGTGTAALVEMWWVRSISRSGEVVSGIDRVEAIDRSPLRAAWIALLQPWDGDATSSNTWLILAVVALVVAAVAWRISPSRPLTASALLALACSSAVAAHFQRPALVNGFLPTFPVLAAGLLVAHRDLLRKPIVAGSLAIGTMTATMLCFTIYDDGGSTQWGGRFFQFLVPLLAPVAAIGALRALSRLGRNQRRLAVTGVALVAVLISAVGVRAEISYRAVHRTIRLATERTVSGLPSGLSRGSVLLVATRTNDGFSRTFWRKNNDFVTIRSSNSSAFAVLRRLHDEGLEGAYVVTPGDVELMELGGRFELERLGWERLETHKIPGLSVQILRYGPPRGGGDG